MARLGAGIAGLALCITLLAPGVASAGGGPPLSFARLLTPPKTLTAQYSCDLSAYQSGLAPPHTSTASLPAITCTTTATTQDIPVTVTLGVFGTKGPEYTCDLTALHIKLEEFLAHIPMTVTEAGQRTVGKTVTVGLRAGIGGPCPAGTTNVRFSGDLPVLGAQRGQITFSEPITDLGNPTTRASGKLRLTTAGPTVSRYPRTSSSRSISR